MVSEPFSVESERAFLLDSIHPDEHLEIIAGITTRRGGVSDDPFATLNMGYHVHDNHDAVKTNRERLADDLSFPLDSWVGAEQVHGINLAHVTTDDRGKGARDLISAIKATDGLYTTEPNILLTVCFADCVPIYFYSINKTAVGLLHAGWKGTVHSGASEMVHAWERNLKIPSHDIHVVIGPSIRQCCYEVDQRVMSHVQSLEGVDAGKFSLQMASGRFMLDLQGLNKAILMTAGILDENIHISQFCTSCRTDHFFSHRGENSRTGRILGFIGIHKGDENESLK